MTSSSSICPLLLFSQTSLSHKGLFLWSKTHENNRMERQGYIKKLHGFVRYNLLVFSFKYLQLCLIFIEKQNKATKSFLEKISGPFCIVLTAETTTAALQLFFLKTHKGSLRMSLNCICTVRFPKIQVPGTCRQVKIFLRG